MAATLNENTRFRWDKGEKMENLIKCLSAYKTKCAYEGKYCNADKPKLYDCIREKMARIYEDEPTYFGPVFITPNPYH